MQFVAIKPSVLSNSAKEQLKKAEEIKTKTKEIARKEEPEDWQDVSFIYLFNRKKPSENQRRSTFSRNQSSSTSIAKLIQSPDVP
jgi:hypothetical protein